MHAHITVDGKTAFVFLPGDRQAIYQPNSEGVWDLVNYVDSNGLSISTHLAEDISLLGNARSCFEAALADHRRVAAEYANMMREHVALGKERTALARQQKRDRQK